MTVIQILVPDDQCPSTQQQPLLVQPGPDAPVLVSLPVQPVQGAVVPMSSAAVSPMPVAPLRQIPPAAPVPLEEVETPVNQMQDIDTDGLDLREFRDLVRAFKEKRVGLGLTQTQAGMDLQGEEDKWHNFFSLLNASGNNVCKNIIKQDPGRAKQSCLETAGKISPNQKNECPSFLQLQRRPRGSRTVRASCAVWSGWT